MNPAARIALSALAVTTLALGGCASLRPHAGEPAPTPAHPAPPPKPVPVLRLPRPAPPPAAPQVRSCVPRSLAPPPRYPDTDAALRAAPGAADRYQLLAAGRLLRQQRLEELERAIAACRQP